MAEDATSDATAIAVEIDGVPLSKVIQEVEHHYFAHVLTKAHGNRAEAARIAGMKADTFRKRIKNYDFKTAYAPA